MHASKMSTSLLRTLSIYLSSLPFLGLSPMKSRDIPNDTKSTMPASQKKEENRKTPSMIRTCTYNCSISIQLKSVVLIL